MNFININFIIALVPVSMLSSCVSMTEYKKLEEKAMRIENTLEKERRESYSLADEKISLEGFTKSKNVEINKIQQKNKEELETLNSKYNQLQADYTKMVVSSKKLQDENISLKTLVEITQQEKEREIEDLQSKLRWVYVKYNVRRSAN
jgi:hypothetical protein